MTGKHTLSRQIALGLLVAAAAAPGAQAANRPDDRAGQRGAEPAAGALTSAVRPDDRAGPLGVAAASTPGPAAALRPDNRAGRLGVGATEQAAASDDAGFDWGAAAIGLAAGFVLAVILAGGLLLATHRVSWPRKIGAPAAG
jgi:hypothetical protein